MTGGAPLRVVIAGGGVAGLEATLALRALADDRVTVTILAPEADFVYRPMTVREPFAFAAAQRHDLGRMAEEMGAKLVVDAFARVHVTERTVATASGEHLPYDALVLALGAHR
jgi:sulfide:quinone oxidoreductase